MRASENIALQSNGNITLANGTTTLTWVGGMGSSGIEAIEEIRVAEKGICNLGVAFKNLTAASATITISDISVLAQLHPDGPWLTLASGTSFSGNRIVKDSALFTSAGVISGASFSSVLTNQTVWFLLSVPSVYNIKVQVTSGGGTVKGYCVGYKDDITMPVENDGGALEVTQLLVSGALGATTDAPLGLADADEGATARSQTSLLKRVVNYLKAIYGKDFSTTAKQDSIITLLTPTYHAPVGNAYEITATQTLAEITSAAIPAWVREVTLIPRSTGVFWSTSGDASLSTMLLPLGGISIPGTAASLATIELFAVPSTVVDIIYTGVAE